MTQTPNEWSTFSNSFSIFSINFVVLISTFATTAIRLLNLNRLVLSLNDPYFRISSASGMGFGGVYAMCIPAAFEMTRGIFHIGGTCNAMVLRRDRCARA